MDWVVIQGKGGDLRDDRLQLAQAEIRKTRYLIIASSLVMRDHGYYSSRKGQWWRTKGGAAGAAFRTACGAGAGRIRGCVGCRELTN